MPNSHWLPKIITTPAINKAGVDFMNEVGNYLVRPRTSLTESEHHIFQNAEIAEV